MTTTSLKRQVERLPVVGPALRRGWSTLGRRRFGSSAVYWDRRYRSGGTSGAGSSGRLAEFKASVLNAFVAERGVETVIEWGCGDGSQLALARYPHYLGIDVSATAVAACRDRFAGDPTKAFTTPPSRTPMRDLALSLDVTYHLVEDDVFAAHLRDLFASAGHYAVLYTSDSAAREPAHEPVPHIRHRRVAEHVRDQFPAWVLRQRIANPFPYDAADPTTSFAAFTIYERGED